MRNILKPVLKLYSQSGEQYLTRWSLLAPKADEVHAEWKQGRISQWLCENVGQVYLHKIDGPDPDRNPHDHPWLALCFVLWGGYCQFRHGRGMSRFEGVRWFNYLRRDEYHRILSVRPNTWTLCFCGPVFRSWGFLMSDGRHMPWREYLGLTRGERSDAGNRKTGEA